MNGEVFIIDDDLIGMDDEDEIVRGEKVASNPIPEERYEQFKFKLEEISKKYAERNLMIFYIGVATGYRTQDIVRLTIGEIKDFLDNERFMIQEQKQYKAWLKAIQENPRSKRKQPKKREVPIKPTLRKLIKEYIKSKPKSEYAFPSNKGNSHITAKAFSNILANTGKLLVLENISGHSMRKTYANRIFQVTKSLEYVRIALGHKSIETTKVYLGLNNEVRKGAAKIADDRI